MSQFEQRSLPEGSPGAVLAAARGYREAELAAATGLLEMAVEWASMHEPTQAGVPAATWWEAGRSISIAGAGAPLIAEYAVAEFAAAVGMSTDQGRSLIGQGLDLAYRLPNTWDLLHEGKVPAWRARRFADLTRSLTKDAAGFVDDQISAVAGKVSWAGLDRLVTEAARRYLPQTMDDPAEAEAEVGRDRRGVAVRTDQAGLDGVVPVEAYLSVEDALDFEHAVQAGAEQLKTAGSTDSLDGRRATAVGEMARDQLALDLAQPDPSADEPASFAGSGRVRRPRDPVVLYLHLSEDAVTGRVGELERLGQVGRCENTRSPVTAETIRSWCGAPGARVVVKPVIDLRAHVRVEQYEIPDRLIERIDLRDVTCCFPWCSRPARRVCDHDHAIPHDSGGPTCDCNLAALCRHHHRLKTHTGWRYKILEPGLYLWTSPHGYVFLRDHSGTTDVTPAGLTVIPGCPDDPDPPE